MKVLLDSCVSGKTRVELEAAGYDVDWSGEWPIDPGDEEILARAYDAGRVLVTLDKDFGELAHSARSDALRHHSAGQHLRPATGSRAPAGTRPTRA